MQETIDRLYADNTFEFELPADEAMTTASEVGTDLQVEEIQKLSSAAAGEGGSNQHFRQLPNSFIWPR